MNGAACGMEHSAASHRPTTHHPMDGQVSQMAQMATAAQVNPLGSPVVSQALHDSLQPAKSDDEPPDSDAHMSDQTLSVPPSTSQSHPILDQALQAASTIFLDICAGASRPLSATLLQMGFAVLSFDILLNSQMDLLDNSSFESLLRLASSGQVGYGAARPSCNDYSRINLKADSGPRAIRTPEHINGIPNLTHSERLRLQSSHQMLYRCLVCLSLIFQAGCHCHLEQPANAMSWLEPMTKQFLLAISATCICIPACKFDWNIDKHGCLRAVFTHFRFWAATVNTPHTLMTRFKVCGNQWGNFVSRATACYPPALATEFAKNIASLLTPGRHGLIWTDIHHMLPSNRWTIFHFFKWMGVAFLLSLIGVEQNEQLLTPSPS